MRICKLALPVLLLTACAAFSQTAPKTSAVTKAPVSFDKSAMDTTANPCEDFFQYTCGGWRKANPIPADKVRYGRFDELREYNLNVLHSILEDVTKPGKHTANEKKVGDFYRACMNEAAVETQGANPIKADLERIAAIKDRKGLVTEFASMHQRGLRGSFGFGIGPDLHNSSMNIAQVDQGGLSLADRDYYIKQDAKSTEVRAKYVEHVQKMFELLGEPADKAAADAKSVMAIETKLAEASMDRVQRRNPKSRDHKMKVTELAALAPNVDFPAYFATTGVGSFEDLNVGNPEFFKQLNGYLETIPVEDWKTYMRWSILRGSAGLLSSKFVDESFRFNDQYMGGQEVIEARWKRCTRLTDGMLGEALGPLYVAKAFPPSAKKRMDTLVAAIEKQMDVDIKSLEWMSPETKVAAKGKLDKVSNKIGYPEKWKDYSNVVITPTDLVSNARNARRFEVQREYDRLGKKVDKMEWGMTPPTVNAYYSPAHNNINFPAGILQAPFFSDKIDDSVNFGGIGVVIGHELTHGFDDQGRKFDGDGNLTDWWGPKDGPEFESRAQCIIDEYGSFVSVKDDKGEVKLNGKLTLGENTADNGGMKLAYMALMDELGAKANQSIDGYTPAQRFFIGFGQVWCENVTPQRARELALTDPHSAGRFRVIGTVQNSLEFRKAFNCKAGQPMAPEKPCAVW
jgi:predicted metalloendopeptidase